MTSKIADRILIIVLVLWLLLMASQCHADTRQFLNMCESAQNSQVEHGYCEGYIAAVQAMSGTEGEDGVCVGNTSPQDVLASVVWNLDAAVKRSDFFAKGPPVDTVSAALVVLYPCGSGLTSKLPKRRRHK